MEKYLDLAKDRYTSNIRGHDCFAFLGHCPTGSEKPYAENSHDMLHEIDALAKISAQHERHDIPLLSGLLLSLGPAPGSFFADSPVLKRYRWANLPVGLEDTIQEEVCRKGYGKIHDVAINSVGGWVLQLKEGKRYRWGGNLPTELQNALSKGLAGDVQLMVRKDVRL